VALRLLGIKNIPNKASVLDRRPSLITDGAVVNESEQNGMMGKLQVCPLMLCTSLRACMHACM
jgi:hypothetical protein